MELTGLSSLINKRTIMEPSKLLNATYLDIIFDNRNKNYGGYELRKHYNQRLGKAVIFLLLGLGAVASFSFISSHKAEQLHSRAGFFCPKIIEITLPKQMPKVQELHHPATPPQHIRARIFTDPVITDNELVKPEQQMTAARDSAMPGPSNTEGNVTGAVTTTEHGTGVIDQPSKSTGKPVSWVPQMPQFEGDMYAYIGEHLRYPEAARIENITGQVLIRFVVNEDGTVSDAIVVHGIGGGCDEEAINMVSNMPKWKPGKQNGTTVKVLFTLPVNFVLN